MQISALHQMLCEGGDDDEARQEVAVDSESEPEQHTPRGREHDATAPNNQAGTPSLPTVFFF